MFFFSHILQPPSYLKLPIFALDISDQSFKYIQFKEKQRVRHVHTFGSGVIAKGLIESGVITDVAKLAETLRDQLAGKAFRYVALALPEEKGFVRTIRIPEVADNELREAIALQLEEYVPLPPEQTSFAYHLLPQNTPRTMDILIAAYPAQLVSAYRDAVEQAGFTPVSLEIESQAIARAVIPPNQEQEAILVVDIGRTRTSFLYAQNGYTKLTSTISVGGNTMHESIMKQMRVSEAEAEQLKKDRGLARAVDGKQVYDALLPLVVSIKNEIRQRTEFWRQEMREEKKTPNTPELSRIYLCGREANLLGLPSFLSSQLGVPVSLANVWLNALQDQRFVPEIEFHDSLGYATSIGLALGAEEL